MIDPTPTLALPDGAPPASPSPSPGPARSRLARLGSRSADIRYLGVAGVLVVMCVVFAILRSDFTSHANLVNLLSSTSILALVALGLTFVMIAGQFDLSVGATLALCGFVYAWFFNDLHVGAPLSLVFTILAGGLLGGIVNGFLVGRLKMSFLVVTLGMLVLEQGLVQLVSTGQTKEVTSTFMDGLAFNAVAGVPVVMIVVVAAYAIATYFLRYSFFGRDVYAVGGNPLAAQLSGISVVRTVVLVFAIAGAGAAFGGVVQVARIGAASPSVGGTIVFDATAAVLLGGAALSGGVGSMGGTAIGVLFLGVLQNGLTLTGIPGYWQQIATGTIVIGSVLINQRTATNEVT
ncbi:MAG: rbsC [Solirubrobacterales bacterium]|nr:rbsC [Solirubrobacterales bacterium]